MWQFVSGSVKTIDTRIEAAKHILEVGVDNAMGNHISNALDESKEFENWKKQIPDEVPINLSKYQEEHSNKSDSKVSDDINKLGLTLSEGQILFHGGTFNKTKKKEFTTSLPLSTSFCPQVALRNAEHNGKAYDENEIGLYALRVKDSETKVFPYKQKAANLGDEKEVLFAAGAVIKIIKKIDLGKKIVYKQNEDDPIETLQKEVSVYVTEVEIS